MTRQDKRNEFDFHQAGETEEVMLEVYWEYSSSVPTAIFSVQVCDLGFHFLCCACLKAVGVEVPSRAGNERNALHCLVLKFFRRSKSFSRLKICQSWAVWAFLNITHESEKSFDLEVVSFHCPELPKTLNISPRMKMD